MASIYDRAGGVLELLAQGATGFPAQLGGGLTYAATAPFVGNDAAQAMKRRVEDEYTYQPRTETAQGIIGAIGRTVAPAVNYAGGNIERTAQQVGQYAGPAGYAAVKSLPTVLQTLADRPKIGSGIGGLNRAPANIGIAESSRIPIGKVIDEKVGDTTISYSVDESGLLTVGSVRTPQSKRGNGSAREAMGQFLRRSDELGYPVELIASPLDKKTNQQRLEAFYESLGFNKTDRKANPAGDFWFRRESGV